MRKPIKMNARLKRVLGLFCITLAFVSCTRDAFEIKLNANDLFHVKNNDYLIPVLVRGNTASQRMILFIQGGPGSNSLDFAEVDYPEWKNTLEKEYAVAYYEQRGTGNSQGNFHLGKNIVQTYVEDVHAVAAFLEKAYNAEIIMMGHSFGGGLVYEYMIRYGDSGIPTKYISMDGPASSDAELDMLRWNFRREFLYNTANLEISRGINVTDWNTVLDWLSVTPEIKKIEGNNPYKLMIQWNAYVEDLIFPKFPEKSPKLGDYAHVVFASSYNPIPSFLSGKKREELEELFFEEESKSYETGNQLMNRLPAIDNQSILLITGRYDDVCPPEELAYIYSQIPSAQKQMKVIDNAGHQIFIDQSTEFFNTIRLFIEQ